MTRRTIAGTLCLVGGLMMIVAALSMPSGVNPGPTPGPAPTPQPVPVTSFRVIFVKESGATLSGEQSQIPAAAEIREYLEAKTTPESGQPGWREYDPEQITANEQPTMMALWEASKPKLIPPPCIVVELNGKATVQPMPATVAETMAILKKAAGE